MLNIDGMQLAHLRSVKSGECGGTDIYRDVSAPSGGLYTVVTATGEQQRRMLAAAVEEIGQHWDSKVSPIMATRSENDRLMLIFRYNTERLLLTFAPTQCPLVEQKIELCKRLVRECMSMKLPYWLLEMSLNSDNINLERDGSININIFVDPQQAGKQSNEKLCVAACADIICAVLAQLPVKMLKECKTYWLIYKKSRNGSHSTFVQLYRDIESSSGGKKYSLRARIKQYFTLNKDELFIIGKRLACLMVAVLVLLLLQRLLFSKVSLWGLRYTGLKQIGTVWLK